MAETNDLDKTCGLTDEELTHRFMEAVRIENDMKKAKGLPIAGFYKEKRLPYLEYQDGSREYVEKARNYRVCGS